MVPQQNEAQHKPKRHQVDQAEASKVIDQTAEGPVIPLCDEIAQRNLPQAQSGGALDQGLISNLNDQRFDMAVVLAALRQDVAHKGGHDFGSPGLHRLGLDPQTPGQRPQALCAAARVGLSYSFGPGRVGSRLDLGDRKTLQNDLDL